jgi:hypothetical protein
MKEHPILFSGAMVRALIDGSKTQTRRIVKPQPVANHRGKFAFDSFTDDEAIESYWQNYPLWGPVRSPFGKAGDRLWLRENLKYVDTLTTRHDHLLYAADDVRVPREPGLADWACDGMAFGFANSVPSIHMPRWASRITLEVTGVRIERLRDISEADATAEGTTPSIVGADLDYLKYRAGFQTLWDSLNASRGYGWDVNPWIWVIEFKRIAG